MLRTRFRARTVLLIWCGIAVFLLLAGAVAIYALKSTAITPRQISAGIETQFSACQKQTLEQVSPGTKDMKNLYDFMNFCYWTLWNLGQLKEFEIRRAKFVQQDTDDIVLLWMVVAITISGVILAGLQLLASYRLASAGHGEFAQDSEFVLERNRVSLKSSITGLLILTVSFGFFIIYVLYVHAITGEVRLSPINPNPPSVTGGGLAPATAPDTPAAHPPAATAPPSAPPAANAQ